MENESIIALISLSLTLLIFFISEDLIKTFNNSKKALSNPRSMTSFLLKLFSNGFETSISFISKDLAETFVVEKKIFRARIIKRIYSLFKKAY